MAQLPVGRRSIRPMGPAPVAGGYDSSGINPGGMYTPNPLHGDTPNLGGMVQGISPLGQEIPAAGGTPTGFDPRLGVQGPTAPSGAAAAPDGGVGIPTPATPIGAPGGAPGGLGMGPVGGMGGMSGWMDKIGPMLNRLPADSPWRAVVQQMQDAYSSGNYGQGQIRDLLQNARAANPGSPFGGFGSNAGNGARQAAAVPPAPGTPFVPPVAATPFVPPTPPAARPAPMVPSTANNAFNLSPGLAGKQSVGGFGGSALAGGMPRAFNTTVPPTRR